MTPADLRALAERVGTDTNTNPSGLQRLVCRALGYNLDYQPPNFLHDLNAIAAAWEPLRAKGWLLVCRDGEDRRLVLVSAWRPGRNSILTSAPTEPAARLSLLLRVMAVEVESAQ